MLDDLSNAIRRLSAAPSFTLVAILTLALGIGANTSAFSILDTLLLRPLPYADAAQLDRIHRVTAQSSRGNVSPADYLDLKSEMKGYGDVAAYGVSDMSVSEPGEPAEMAPGLQISANFFSTLGVEPELGRTFRDDENTPGRRRVAILSYRYWQNRFAGDPRIIGRTVRIDGEPHEVVGVMPSALNDWRHLGPFELYRPLHLSPEQAADRSSTWLRLVGRRSKAIARGQAEALVAEFGRRLARDFPGVNAGTAWRTLPLYDSAIPPNAKGIVGMLVGLSGFVLLIACSNLANLLLARTVSRARELAVRAALGASRLRLLRPLFVEALVLALAGGVCAIQVARWTQRWLNGFASYQSGDPLIFSLDWRVLGWAFGACLFTALAFGVAPALFAVRLDPNHALKSGSRGAVGDSGHGRFRQVLIAGQFTLAMVLLAGAALFVRGLQDWNNRSFGWESSGLVTGTLLLPNAAYPSGQEITEFHGLALERLNALPGVASASISYSMPFFGLGENRKYVVAGREIPKAGQEPTAATNGVSPRYFETVGTPLIEGRDFNEGDTARAPRVFIVNQAMARGLFPGQSPLGRRLGRPAEGKVEWGEIVGVAGDIQSVASDRMALAYQVYQPFAQEPRPTGEIAVRAAGTAPETLVAGIRTAMMSLDPDLPVRQLQTAEARIAQAGNYQRIIGSLLSMLAALGLGLAALGVYGVVACTVSQRMGEFGIRLALGARAGDITRLVLGSGAKLALLGSGLGLVGAIFISRLIVAGFPGLRTDNVLVLIGVTAVLVGVALFSSWLPARRAARVDPSIALRAE
jgi:predicted permease